MPSDSRCPSRQKLEAYFLHRSGPDAAVINAHLEWCEPCRVALKSLETLNLAPEQSGAIVAGNRKKASNTAVTLDQFPFLLPPVEDDEIGRLGNYRVLRLLGEGGMAYVFLAEDIALCRQVALKVMKPEASKEGGWQRFLREARTLASIKHEHLVTVYFAGQEDDVAFYAMELLHGETLADRLAREGRLSIDEVVRIGQELADGLAFIHRNGLVHRDIKPGNIWLEGDTGMSAAGGKIKILDLGLARQVKEDVALTRHGSVLGTPGFMSPEQARGETLDARSDLFSLGCVLHLLCTGTQPFDGPTMMAVLTKLAVESPPPADEINPRVPSALSRLVTQLLAKKPEDRPASAEVVRDRLARISDKTLNVTGPAPAQEATLELPAAPPLRKKNRSRGPRRRRKRWLVPVVASLVAVVVIVVAAIVVVRWNRSRPGSEEPSDANTRDVVYLSNLKPFDEAHWPFVPPPRPPEPGKEPPPLALHDGMSPVRVGGRTLVHGIFMHPPPPHEGVAGISYQLGRRYSTFTAEASMNDGPERSESPCTFRVLGDGKELWKSSPISSRQDAGKCEVDVKNVDVLRLEVSCAGEPRGAHMVWIDPRVTK